MNNSNDLPPSYDEVMGGALAGSNVEFLASASTNQPSTSRIGFENINNNIRTSNPTLFPYANFNVKTDTQIILDAVNSKSENVLVKLLCQRSASQREEIANLYLRIKNESLARDIKLKFGYFTRNALILIGLSVPYYEYLARNIHTCNRFKWIYYILFTIPMHEITSFKNYFFTKYKRTPHDFLKLKSTDETNSFNFDPIKKVLKYPRNEIDRNNINEVNDDVAQLKQLVGGSFFGGNQSELNLLKEIFLTKSFSHIKKVCEKYQSSTGIPIQIILKKCTATHNLFSHIAEYAMSPPKYFARTLKKAAFMGITHDEYLLTHIIIRRSEIDLKDIKMEYNALGEKSLTTKIRDKTSGCYKRALLRLLGEPEDY